MRNSPDSAAAASASVFVSSCVPFVTDDLVIVTDSAVDDFTDVMRSGVR